MIYVQAKQVFAAYPWHLMLVKRKRLPCPVSLNAASSFAEESWRDLAWADCWELNPADTGGAEIGGVAAAAAAHTVDSRRQAADNAAAYRKICELPVTKGCTKSKHSHKIHGIYIYKSSVDSYGRIQMSGKPQSHQYVIQDKTAFKMSSHFSLIMPIFVPNPSELLRLLWKKAVAIVFSWDDTEIGLLTC